VLLYNGSREQVDPRTGALEVISFARNAIDLTQDNGSDEPKVRDPTEMSLGELLFPAPGSVNPRLYAKQLAEAHRRLSSPLTCVSYALLALAAILGGRFRRHGGGVRVFTAVLIATGLVALGVAFDNLAARNPALLALMWLHAILPGVVCAWLLFAPRGEAVPRAAPSPPRLPHSPATPA
jgi:lipopolysaccharide export system permease protein